MISTIQRRVQRVFLMGKITQDQTQRRGGAERRGRMKPGFVKVLVREMEWSLFDSPRLCVSFFERIPQRIWLHPQRVVMGSSVQTTILA